MTLLDHHKLQPFWDLAGGQVKIKALEIALSKSLFDLLLSRSNAEGVAHHESFDSPLNVKNTEVWLDLLWSMGCLEKFLEETSGEVLYSTSEMAKNYFVPNSSLDCSQAVAFRLNTLQTFTSGFEKLLHAPERVPKKENNAESALNMAVAWADAAKAQIFQEQRAVTVPMLNKIMDYLMASGDGVFLAEQRFKQMHFLDLGGGPGLSALALAKRFPEATGVVFDFPETAKVANDNILAAGLQNRVSIQSGDLNTAQPEGAFDLIWCSSVLHFLDSADEAIARISTLLKPNGILLILHAEQTPEKDHCERVLPFYLFMVMKGNYLPKQGEISKILNQNSISVIASKQVACSPMAPVWLHVGRKNHA